MVGNGFEITEKNPVCHPNYFLIYLVVRSPIRIFQNRFQIIFPILLLEQQQ